MRYEDFVFEHRVIRPDRDLLEELEEYREFVTHCVEGTRRYDINEDAIDLLGIPGVAQNSFFGLAAGSDLSGFMVFGTCEVEQRHPPYIFEPSEEAREEAQEAPEPDAPTEKPRDERVFLLLCHDYGPDDRRLIVVLAQTSTPLPPKESPIGYIGLDAMLRYVSEQDLISQVPGHDD